MLIVQDLTVTSRIIEHRELILPNTKTPRELHFVFPIRDGGRRPQEVFRLFNKMEYDKYYYDSEGGGCLYWVKCMLSDIILLKWIEPSEEVKKELKRLDSYKKDSEVGESYYVAYGIGIFEKGHPAPKLEINYT